MATLVANIKRSFGKYLFFALNFAFSIFIYGNVTEKAFLVDLPYFDSISSTLFPERILAEVDYKFGNKNSTSVRGFFGYPQAIRIPRLGTILDLDTPIFSDNSWKVSNTKAYIVPFTTSKSGLMASSLIFSKKNYIPMDTFLLVSEGDRIVLETDNNWIYTYKVFKKRIYKSDEAPVIDMTSPSTLVISKELSNSDTYLVLEAGYVNVEAAE